MLRSPVPSDCRGQEHPDCRCDYYAAVLLCLCLFFFWFYDSGFHSVSLASLKLMM